MKFDQNDPAADAEFRLRNMAANLQYKIDVPYMQGISFRAYRKWFEDWIRSVRGLGLAPELIAEAERCVEKCRSNGGGFLSPALSARVHSIVHSGLFSRIRKLLSRNGRGGRIRTDGLMLPKHHNRSH